MGNYAGLIINGQSTANEQAGYSVAGIGDINGDGFDDVAIGAINADVTVDVGGTDGFQITPEAGLMNAPYGTYSYAHFGCCGFGGC